VAKVYDGLLGASVAYGDNRVAGDVLSFSGSANYLDKNVGIAKPVDVNGIALGGADAGNYTYNTTAVTSADITARPLTVSATGAPKVYDGLLAAVATLSDNRVAGDALTLGYSTANFGDKNVGIGKAISVSGIALGGADAGNYTFNITAAASADITARALIVTATGVNKVYDGLTSASVNYGDNRIAGDVLSFSGSATFNNKNVGLGKPVSVSGIALGGADAGNYTYNTTASTLADISARSLSVSATGVGKVYDGKTTATVSFTDNRVAGDVLSLGGSASYADKNVGAAKPVAVSGIALTGTDAGNYTLSATTASTTADITVRPLSTWIGSASGNWSAVANWDALPDLSNVTAVSVPSGASVTYDTAAGTTNLGSLTAGGLNIAGGSLNIANSLTVSSSFGQSGGTLGFGSGASASITQASGNLVLAGLSAPLATLAAPAGAISQSAPIVANGLITKSLSGTTLTNAGNKIASFTAANTGSGNVSLTNTSALSIGGVSNTGGNITIDNTGAVTTVGAISAPAGTVSIVAHSPLSIGTAGVSAGGNISLSAGNTLPVVDHLTLDGVVQTSGSASTITLFAGDNLIQNASVKTNGGAVSATAQQGSISMAPGATTSTAGGAIGYKAPLGSITLASLDAGSGAIDLSAGGSINPVAGFTGANLIGGKATIFAGGNANLSTQVKLLDVTVNGLFTINDLLTGSVMTNAPVTDSLSAGASSALSQVLSTVTSTTQQQPGQTTNQTPPPPPPTPGSGGSAALLLGGGTQSIGGEEGSFGGGSGDKAGGSRSGDKKDDDRKKEEESGPKKPAAKSAPKKLATCGA
jgi:hypothetical protein